MTKLPRWDSLLVARLIRALGNWVTRGLAVGTHMDFCAGCTIGAVAMVFVVEYAVFWVTFGEWWPGRVVDERGLAGCGCVEQMGAMV